MAEDLEAMFQGFAKLTREERLGRLKSMAKLSDEDLNILEGKQPFDLNLAEHFIENAVGYFPIPLGIATYFRIDGRDIPIPMAVEETSIIAAASGTAKWIRTLDGEVTKILGEFRSTLERKGNSEIQLRTNTDAWGIDAIDLRSQCLPEPRHHGSHTHIDRLRSQSPQLSPQRRRKPSHINLSTYLDCLLR